MANLQPFDKHKQEGSPMADESGSQGSYLPQLLRRSTALAAAGCAFVAGCGAAGGEARYDSSPQFKDGGFHNMANPDLPRSTAPGSTRSTPPPTTWCAWATRRTCSSCAAATG
jgi:hypothetical protein